MADADRSLKLTIETAADPQPINAVQEALNKLDKAVEAAKVEAPQAAEALDKMGTALKTLEKNTVPATDGVKKLGDEKKKLSGNSADSGRAILETSRALEDLQYGISGVLNNLPGLVATLGGGAGLAGVISLVGVGLTQLYKHLGDVAGKTVELTEAQIDETIAAGESAVATAKKAEEARGAKDASDALTESIRASEEALQKEIDALRKNLEETKLLADEKKRVADANKELALAEVDADPNMSAADKLRRKNEINQAAAEESQKQEQELYAAQAKEAEQEAEVKARAAEEKRSLAKKAREAEAAARANADATNEAQIAGGRGEVAFGDLLKGLEKDDKGNLLNEKPLTDGLPEVPKGGSQSGQAAEVSKRLAERLKKLQDLKDANGGASTPALDAAISASENSLKRARGAQELLEQGDGAKALKDRQKGLDGTAAAYGSPETAEAEAEKEDQGATDLRGKADRFRRSARTSKEVHEINTKRASITGDAAVRGAEEKAKADEARKAEAEARGAEQNKSKHDEALGKLREMVHNLAPRLQNSKEFDKVASAGSESQILEVVHKLADMMLTTQSTIIPSMRRDVDAANAKAKQVEQLTAANRRTTDRPSQ